MITLEQYLSSNGKYQHMPTSLELTEERLKNAIKLLEPVNNLLHEIDMTPVVTSGFRNFVVNAAVGGKPGSHHMTCQAIDLADPHGILYQRIKNNPQILENYGLYMEASTKGWVHLQSVATKVRIFNK